MSFNLGSEQHQCYLNIHYRLAPMSFNLGSEHEKNGISENLCLAPMSFNLGSEPLFSNLYLIVT